MERTNRFASPRTHRGTGVLPVLAAALLLGLAAAPAAFAQQTTAPQGEFGEQVEVNEVLLDVLVTDRDGNVIVGLEPSDFVVRENGQPVGVESATFYSSSRLAESPEAVAAKGLSVDTVPEDRYFILFFDDVQRYETYRASLMRQQLRAGKDANRWTAEHLAPADWVAVLGYDRSLQVYTDFTRDPQRIANAIERAASGKSGQANWPSRQVAGDGPSLLDAMPQGKALVGATTRIYDALELVAEGTADIRGRKNLVYFGIGFGQVNDFGLYQRDERYYPEMMRALNDANVAIYPIDVTPQEVEHPFEGALTELSNDTGGRYYPFYTSFVTPLEQISQENTGYYLLSYRSDHPAGQRGFQQVTVEAKNPEFRVRARRGYLYGS